MHFAFFPTPAIIAEIGPIRLHFYGAMYALAAVFGYILVKYFARRKKLEVSNELILDFVFWAFLGGVLGGRIFYVLVYNFPYFWAHPLDIFAVWKGGMSIHGGLLGGALAGIWFVKRKKLPLWEFGGIVTPALALGMMLGRIGNFVNGELCGRETLLPWALECGGKLTHPAQLYAAGKDLLLFALFFFLNTKTTLSGKKLFGSFLVAYGVLRFIVEFFRQPDPQIGFFLGVFSLGQVLSVLVVGIGLFLSFFSSLQKPKILEKKAEK